MKLTEATEDDIDVLVACWYALATDMEQYSEFNTISYENVDDVPEDPFKRHLEHDDVTEYLVEESGEVIGFVTLRAGEHPSREYDTYLDIVNLLVEDDYRGQGYGSAVVSAVKELAREKGCDLLKVSWEWANDGARRFYRDNGFEEKQVTYVHAID